MGCRRPCRRCRRRPCRRGNRPGRAAGCTWTTRWFADAVFGDHVAVGLGSVAETASAGCPGRRRWRRRRARATGDGDGDGDGEDGGFAWRDNIRSPLSVASTTRSRRACSRVTSPAGRALSNAGVRTCRNCAHRRFLLICSARSTRCRPCRTPPGEPHRRAVRVVNMLRGHLKESRTTCLRGRCQGPTFRDALDPQYKANRPPMPDELRAQVEPMMDPIVAAQGILIPARGREADDVIGTLALRAPRARASTWSFHRRQGFRAAGAPGVQLVNTMSGSSSDSDESVVENSACTPADRRLPRADGRQGDNIPGVEKCGPKTAPPAAGRIRPLMARSPMPTRSAARSARTCARLRACRSTANWPRSRPMSWNRRRPTCAARTRCYPCARCTHATASSQALKELDGGASGVAVAGKGAGCARGRVALPRRRRRRWTGVDPALSEPGEYRNR